MFQNDSLFGRFMNLMFDVICIGLMWVISSIPLVTMGTATTAAYYTMAKCVHDALPICGGVLHGEMRTV